MEATNTIINRRKTKRFRCLSIACAVAVLVVLAIIIPLAVILPRQRHSKGLKSTVLIPLYIYPGSSSWEPLYSAVVARPRLNFIVIVNPDSGPGASQYPGDDYTSQVQKLNTYPNVRTVGYVRTGYTTRNITSVLLDVSTYSGWGTTANTNSNATNLAVHGIFFDEVAHEYSSEAAEYMKTINQAVKNASGILPDKTIIHNPGTIPDTRFADASTDITVVFENSYDSYKAQQAGLASLPLDRSRYSYVIHSVPKGMSKANMGNFVDKLSLDAEFLFLTSLDQNYYESFGPSWRSFIDIMPT